MKSIKSVHQLRYGECVIFDSAFAAQHLNNYAPPQQRYPGVTKILSATKDDSFLIAWRQKVGDAEADRIVKESTDIGSELDRQIFEYLKSGTVPLNNSPLFTQLKPYLDKIDPVALQFEVASDKMNAKGILDCLGYFDGKLSIIDFKNSRTVKRHEWLDDYWLQLTFYAMIIHDTYKVPVKQLVLMIANRAINEPTIALDGVKDHVENACIRLGDYRALR